MTRTILQPGREAMIRLILTNPSQETQVLTFAKTSVSIGRSPNSDICLADLRVSKQHGRVSLTEQGYLYEDLLSTNGSVVIHGGERHILNEGENTSRLLGAGDEVEIASYHLRLDVEEPALAKPGPKDVTVMVARPARDLNRLHADIGQLDAEAAERFLQLVRETALVKKDEKRLAAMVGLLVFQTFPSATHLSLLTRDLETGRLKTFFARHRDGRRFHAALSQTIVNRVLQEGSSLLFTGADEVLNDAESVVREKIETAICAPLAGTEKPFGVLQIDIRFPGKGVFTSRDLDLLTLFAAHVSLVLENLQLYQEQRRALESTINALVHSLSLKDPETAHHSERVQKVAMRIGREMGLTEDELEILSVASILHDTGKQGVRNEVLFKPGKLTPEESEEIAGHAEHTQGILDRIAYPEHLKTVPLIAAYHHEKMNGKGPYGISGDQIPVQARIIAVADAFDALASKRAYKEAKPLSEVMRILDKGRDHEWDGCVVDALERVAQELAIELNVEIKTTGSGAYAGIGFGSASETAAAQAEAPRLPRSHPRRTKRPR
jgi:HD-GYP domain-containing protein (c-di-GMP phosphodiesterase class II)/pSer/pThr/pTyr-binding forkhead associated (FHA) protein